MFDAVCRLGGQSARFALRCIVLQALFGFLIHGLRHWGRATHGQQRTDHHGSCHGALSQGHTVTYFEFACWFGCVVVHVDAVLLNLFTRQATRFVKTCGPQPFVQALFLKRLLHVYILYISCALKFRLTFTSNISMSKRYLALISATALVLLSACSSTKLAETTDLSGKATDSTSGAPAPISGVAAVVADHLNPNSLISTQRSVYFDFDQFTIKAESAPVIERQGKYLASKSSLAIRVEGNADERGGREYNLALGQKRAEAVVRALKVYGVSDKQVEPVSFGSEKPVALGHDEESWAKNRRVDFAYPSK